MPCLTIGMATYKDFDGVYFTIQALRLYHDLTGCELVVIDNYGCSHTKDFCTQVGVRYVKHESQGTAGPRNRIFSEAKGNAVLCLDCHVLLPGTGEMSVIKRLKHYYQQNPNTKDLLQGPLLYDNLKSISTHFEPFWQDKMWGIWSVGDQGLQPQDPPFEIPMQGLGLFSCRREAWPGFNLRFRGFGGEEGYIHEKFRLRGGKCLCLPWMRWVHRFGRPNGTGYANTVEDRLFNYLVGHSELGMPLEPIVEHFQQWVPQATINRIVEEARVSRVPAWAQSLG